MRFSLLQGGLCQCIFRWPNLTRINSFQSQINILPHNYLMNFYENSVGHIFVANGIPLFSGSFKSSSLAKGLSLMSRLPLPFPSHPPFLDPLTACLEAFF